MQTLALGLLLQVFFPIFENPGPAWSGISIVNSSGQTEQFTIRLFSPQGEEVRTHPLTITGGGQRNVALNEFLPGPDARLSGWVRVDGSTADFKTYMTMGDGAALAAAEPVPSPALSQAVHLPDLRVHKGFLELNETDTQIVIINASNYPADVSVTLVDRRGTIRSVHPLNIAPNGSSRFRVSEALPSIPGVTEFEGRALILSNVAIAAWRQVETPLVWDVLRAKHAAEFPNTAGLIAPYFVIGGFYESELILSNPGGLDEIALDVEGRDGSGLPIGEKVRVTLAPGQSFASEIGRLLNVVLPAVYPAPVITGSLRIHEAEGRPFRIIGTLKVTGFDAQFNRHAGMAYFLSDTPALTWEIPFTATSPQYYTAYAVAAANELLAVQTDVTIEVVDDNSFR